MSEFVFLEDQKIVFFFSLLHFLKRFQIDILFRFAVKNTDSHDTFRMLLYDSKGNEILCLSILFYSRKHVGALDIMIYDMRFDLKTSVFEVVNVFVGAFVVEVEFGLFFGF